MSFDICYYSKNTDEILLENGIKKLDQSTSVQSLVLNPKEFCPAVAITKDNDEKYFISLCLKMFYHLQ